jgi:hypothetical protein
VAEPGFIVEERQVVYTREETVNTLDIGETLSEHCSEDAARAHERDRLMEVQAIALER